MRSFSQIALGLLGATHVAYGTKIHQLWQFPNATQWIENLVIRPNGHLLLDTFDDGKLYSLDPRAKNPVPSVVAQIPGLHSLTGITEVSPDVYVLAGGSPDQTGLTFLHGTGKVVVVDFKDCGDEKDPVVKTIAEFPNAGLLNGVTTLPLFPHVVLVSDSIPGTITRIDTLTGRVDIVYQNEQLQPVENATIPLGINGLRVHGDYLYVTNTAKHFLARLKINSVGKAVGKLEILAQFSSDQQPDDIAVARDGTTYVSSHPSSVLKVTPSGKVSDLAENSNVFFDQPTSAQLSKDEKTLYVTAGGGTNGKGGQVVAIEL